MINRDTRNWREQTGRGGEGVRECRHWDGGIACSAGRQAGNGPRPDCQMKKTWMRPSSGPLLPPPKLAQAPRAGPYAGRCASQCLQWLVQKEIRTLT
jgi:hypothetical protein